MTNLAARRRRKVALSQIATPKFAATAPKQTVLCLARRIKTRPAGRRVTILLPRTPTHAAILTVPPALDSTPAAVPRSPVPGSLTHQALEITSSIHSWYRATLFDHNTPNPPTHTVTQTRWRDPGGRVQEVEVEALDEPASRQPVYLLNAGGSAPHVVRVGDQLALGPPHSHLATKPLILKWTVGGCAL